MATVPGANNAYDVNAEAAAARAFQEQMMSIQSQNATTQIMVQTVMGMNDGKKEVARKLSDSASR